MGARARIGRSALALLCCALGAPRAHSEEPRAACLPEALRLRTVFATPSDLAGALRENAALHKESERRARAKRAFAEAGCTSVEEHAHEGTRETSLVCRIAGGGGRAIAIASSPSFDGWPSAVLLPAIARSVAAAPRRHEYAIALLARSVSGQPIGARNFADSFGDAPPRVFVHVGAVGSGAPQVGPETSDAQRCLLDSISRAELGAPLGQLLAWDQVSVQCLTAGAYRYSGGTESVRICGRDSFERLVDVAAFTRRGVEVAGLYAYPQRDRASFARVDTPRLDPAAYVATHRVLATYAVALDQVLDPPLPTGSPAP